MKRPIDSKTVEIFDKDLHITAIAVALQGDRYLTKASGYNRDWQILLGPLGGGMFRNKPHAWDDRTMAVAHRWIIEHWDVMPDEEVIDVEYILGESGKPKPSERFVGTL